MQTNIQSQRSQRALSRSVHRHDPLSYPPTKVGDPSPVHNPPEGVFFFATKRIYSSHSPQYVLFSPFSFIMLTSLFFRSTMNQKVEVRYSEASVHFSACPSAFLTA